VTPEWFERLVATVPTLQESPFGGFEAPDDGSARRSAVLALFGPGAGGGNGDGGDGVELLLTQRAADLRSHPGQIALPGGRLDPGDAGPAEAALREAAEETRLDPAGVDVRALGPDLYLSVSNNLVTPVIAWWRQPSPVAPGDPAEVARVISVPVAALVDPANRFSAQHPSGFTGPAFAVGDLFVWGFTAGILNWLFAVAGLERPWDAGRLRPIPRELMRSHVSQRLPGDPGDGSGDRIPGRPGGGPGAGDDTDAELAAELDQQVPE
jgi:8-oxo-dGTP pyrophosphatase MutT (NUDIX family)